MHDAAADVPAQGRRVRRWLVRGLLVAGAMAAMTATGWLISTATASASTLPLDDPSTTQPAQSEPAQGDPAGLAQQALRDISGRAGAAGDELRRAARPVTEPLTQTLQHTAEVLQNPQDGLRHAAADAKRVWRQTTGHFGNTVTGVTLTDPGLPQLGTEAIEPAADALAAGIRDTAMSSALAADPVVHPSSPQTSTTAAPQRPHAPAVHDPAGPAAGQLPEHGTPSQPTEPAPINRTPGVVPGGAGGGTTQGSGNAGPGVAAPAPTAMLPNTTLRLPSWRYVPRTHGASARQPGTTPD